MFDVESKELRVARREARVGDLSKFATRASQLAPRALTLIELLVVIVILTTLVAGVIPILSPNNDTRKIREASRMLQTYIMKAQTEAARTGRPQGIGFQEISAGSGVALDVFRLEVPPPFPGFSPNSRVEVKRIQLGDLPSGVFLYGSISHGNSGMKYRSQYNGAQLYSLRFVLAGLSPSADDNDLFPPRMFQVGDLINAEGNMFLVVDDEHDNIKNPSEDGNSPNPTEAVELPNGEFISYLDPEAYSDYFDKNGVGLICVLINDQGQVAPPDDTLKQYKIFRQPASSIEPPLQFPAGIALDLQGSLVEGGSTAGIPLFAGSFDDITNFVPGAPQIMDTVSIMFSPTGSVSAVIHNGQPVTNVSKIALLLGRVENGGLVPELDTSGELEVVGGLWVMEDDNDQDELEEKQEIVNWLNLDSRWLSIAVASGRATVSENAFVNANIAYGNNASGDLVAETAPQKAAHQIEAAHQFAHEMRSQGAGR